MRLARTNRTELAVVFDRAGEAYLLDVPASLEAFHRAFASEADMLAQLVAHLPSWIPIIERWDDASAALFTMQTWADTGDSSVRSEPLEGARLLAPVPSAASRIFAVGANFAPHAALAEGAISGDDSQVSARTAELLLAKHNGEPPWGFNVLPGTIVGPDDEIAPPAVAQRLDYEGEVAVVLRGNTVWGVTAWNDFSIRDPHFGLGRAIDRGPLTWSLQKNFDTANACGPWIVVDEGVDEQRLGLSLRLNGDMKQKGTTAEMIYTFDDVIDHISPFLTVRSGDMIASGTPAGTAFEQGVNGRFLRAGDVVEVEVEGVGVLRNRIVAPKS